MNLMYVTIALFAIAAVLGLSILMKWLTKKKVSRTVIYSHGIFAALGVVLLTVYALQNRSNYPQLGLTLFIIAAVGGFYMFFRDMQNKMSPYSIAFVHTLLAVGGFVALLLFVFS
jgi:hypothetical protein